MDERGTIGSVSAIAHAALAHKQEMIGSWALCLRMKCSSRFRDFTFAGCN